MRLTWVRAQAFVAGNAAERLLDVEWGMDAAVRVGRAVHLVGMLLGFGTC